MTLVVLLILNPDRAEAWEEEGQVLLAGLWTSSQEECAPPRQAEGAAWCC